mmetsp:Transcript_48807/g.88219  ORF Transcript_48807/g.88219 Transcript_48807/m.88219 type:complete len:869 (+) Transcript_48807:128-2734(+)
MTDGKSVMVVRGWGKDKSGISESFLKVIADYKSKLLDLAQFLLEESLMFTFVLEVGDAHSMLLVRDLQKTAKGLGLQVDFDFPDKAEKPAALLDLESGENMVVAYFVSKNRTALTAGFLHDVDSVLALNGCVISEIEHRGDNKIENNGEYTKLSIIIRCPRGMKLGMLYLGEPSEDRSGLQKVAWDHDFQVTVQWWDAMNRPNGKSLVVFGLSHVLCPYDVLDEVLKEAGLDPTAAETGEAGFELTKKKVCMLRGHSTQVIQRVLERIQLTPGAELVISTLKRMGFKLAILTNSGAREIGDHLSKRLEMDYVISQDLEVDNGVFTGEFQGMPDIRFRKSDILKLMADREGIEYRNVISVGEIMNGLKAVNARQVVELFGPTIWFNSNKLEDLTMSLYLLGLNGSDVSQLQRLPRGFTGVSQALGKVTGHKIPAELDRSQDATPKRRLIAQISTKASEPGQIQRIFAPLKSAHPTLSVGTVKKLSLQDGGMVLGVEISLDQAGADNVSKELLLACNKNGYQVMDMTEAVSAAAANGFLWERNFQNRYVITLVQKPMVTSESLFAVLRVLGGLSVNIVKIERLSDAEELSAMKFSVIVPEGVLASDMNETLVKVSQEHKVDLAFQCDDIERGMRRLVVFDMSMLIQQEVIDDLAKMAGVEKEVKTITEQAMRGELDFYASVKAKVALLKGHNAEAMFSKVKENLIFTPGAKRLCSTLKKLGFKMAVISGGPAPVAVEVQRQLGLDYAFANTLEVEEGTGLFTGLTSGPVVTPERKRTLLATIANVEGCDVSQTIAVGDGANDILMLKAAGLGIAFCAKPKVQAAASFRINQQDLSTVLFLIGINDYAADRLAGLEERPLLMKHAARVLKS